MKRARGRQVELVAGNAALARARGKAIGVLWLCIFIFLYQLSGNLLAKHRAKRQLAI